MRARFIFFGMMMLVLSAAPMAFAQRAAPATPPPKLVPAGQAVILLYKEAPDAIAEKPTQSLDEQFNSKPAVPGPGSVCDFAQRRNLTAGNDDVVGVVLRRLNAENPAIDSYVRWQLLSFGPKFDKIEPKNMRTILAALPPLTAQPQYTPPPPPPQGSPASLSIVTQKTVVVGQKPVPGTGGSRPKLAVITSGVSMGNSDPPAARPVDPDAVVAELRDKRRKMASTNKWVVQFRDAIIPLLPEANGVRLTAMLQDTADRIGAGDPTWEDAVARLIAACEALPKPSDAATTTAPALSMDLRRALAEQAKMLGKISTPIIENVVRKSDGEIGLEGYYVQFPPEQLQRMLLLLAGEPVPVAVPPKTPKAESATPPTE